MRKIAMAVLMLLVMVSAGFAQIPGGAPFSADMVVKMKDGNNINGKVYVGSGKMRQEMDVNGHQTVQIIDTQKKVTDILMPQQKMYMEVNFGQMQQQRRGPKVPDLKSFDPTNPCGQQQDMTCEKAGTETVNGRSTEKWIFKNKKDGDTVTAWIDPKIHYPIRTIGKDVQMDLTNVQEGMPSASLFEVPSDYRKFDMGSMRQGQVPPHQ